MLLLLPLCSLARPPDGSFVLQIEVSIERRSFRPIAYDDSAVEASSPSMPDVGRYRVKGLSPSFCRSPLYVASLLYVMPRSARLQRGWCNRALPHTDNAARPSAHPLLG